MAAGGGCDGRWLASAADHPRPSTLAQRSLPGLFFTLDIIFSFHRAVVVRHKFRRRLLTDGRLVARAYVFRGTFLLDIVTTFPFWMQVGVGGRLGGVGGGLARRERPQAAAGRASTGRTVGACAPARLASHPASPQAGLLLSPHERPSNSVSILLGLRVLRLIRVVPVVARMFDLAASELGRSLAGVFSTAGMYLFSLAYVAAVLVNLLACLWFFVARTEGGLQGATTWMSKVEIAGNPLLQAPYSSMYVASAYFAVTTLTTVGYGDITAATTTERLVAMAIMFVGILFFSFVVNSMGATLESSSAAARRSKALRSKFDEVEVWMRSRHLPGPLRRRIMEYYSEVWVRKEEWRETDLYAELPPSLRSEARGWAVGLGGRPWAAADRGGRRPTLDANQPWHLPAPHATTGNPHRCTGRIPVVRHVPPGARAPAARHGGRDGPRLGLPRPRPVRTRGGRGRPVDYA